MGKPTPDMPTSGQSYGYLTAHSGHLAYELGEDAANCTPGGGEQFPETVPASDDSDY